MIKYLSELFSPGPFSQILGALIGALIAISLWNAERSRTINERANEEEKRNERFRKTMKFASGRVRRELDLFSLQAETTISEISDKVGAGITGYNDHYKSVISLLDRFPINIPNSFEFSEIHIAALDDDMAEALVESKDALQELYIELRQLRSNAQSQASAEELCDALAEAVRCATAANEKLVSFEAAL